MSILRWASLLAAVWLSACGGGADSETGSTYILSGSASSSSAPAGVAFSQRAASPTPAP